MLNGRVIPVVLLLELETIKNHDHGSISLNQGTANGEGEC